MTRRGTFALASVGYDDLGRRIGLTRGNGNVLRRYLSGPGVDERILRYEGSGTGNLTRDHRRRLDRAIAFEDANLAMTSAI